MKCDLAEQVTTHTSTQRHVEPSKRAIEAAKGTSLQDSSFTPFLSEGIPEDIKLDPIFIC